MKLKVLKLGGNEIKNISELKKFNFGKLNIISDIKKLDIVYMIDSTGGMGLWISCVRGALNIIYNKLKRSIILREYDIKFGGVFYRDPVDVHSDRHEYKCLGDVKDLVNRMKNIYGEGGGDQPEDWVGAYIIALDEDKMKWREDSVKIIIHIAGSDAHGKEFCKWDRYPEEGPKLVCLIKKCAREKISIFGYNINDLVKKSFIECKRIYDEVKSSNCSFDIYKLYSGDEEITIGKISNDIIKHILVFISQNNRSP